MQIRDGQVAPLLIFRKDNIEQKLNEFAQSYHLDGKKFAKLRQTVQVKMSSLQEFVPNENELSNVDLSSSQAHPSFANLQ